MFLDRFDQLADAPNAVAKSRELVLELAVRGMIVEPSRSTDMHPEWQEFRKQLATRIFGSDPGPLPPFKIPDHWEWCSLDEVANCRASAKVAPAAISDNDWVLDLEDIDGATGKIIQFATFAERRSLSTKASFAHGDVLYGKLRPYLNKVVIAPTAGFCTTEIIPLRPAAFLSSAYLRIYLRSITFLCYTAQKGYGMKMPRLGTRDLEGAKIPIPPPEEQQRIVAKVDELMALCDRLEAQQQEREARHAVLARAALARVTREATGGSLEYLFHASYAISPADLRKSILTIALQGSLVRQDLGDDVEHLLARNDERRREVARRDHRADLENQPLLSAEDRWCIPANWTWRALADLVLFVDYRGKTPVKLSHGVRLITAKNVRQGHINLSPEEFVSEEYYHKWMTRGLPRIGDVLFTTEAPMGNAAVVNLTERFALAQRTICFQAYGALHPPFMALQIQSEQFQRILDKNGTGVTAKGIKASKLKQLPIAVPPLAEQLRIVAKVDQLMILVSQLEVHIGRSQSLALQLLDALVSELTKGRTLQ